PPPAITLPQRQQLRPAGQVSELGFVATRIVLAVIAPKITRPGERPFGRVSSHDEVAVHVPQLADRLGAVKEMDRTGRAGEQPFALHKRQLRAATTQKSFGCHFRSPLRSSRNNRSAERKPACAVRSVVTAG